MSDWEDREKELERIKETQRKLERDIRFNKIQFICSGILLGFAGCYIVRSIFEVLAP